MYPNTSEDIKRIIKPSASAEYQHRLQVILNEIDNAKKGKLANHDLSYKFVENSLMRLADELSPYLDDKTNEVNEIIESFEKGFVRMTQNGMPSLPSGIQNNELFLNFFYEYKCKLRKLEVILRDTMRKNNLMTEEIEQKRRVN